MSQPFYPFDLCVNYVIPSQISLSRDLFFLLYHHLRTLVAQKLFSILNLEELVNKKLPWLRFELRSTNRALGVTITLLN